LIKVTRAGKKITARWSGHGAGSWKLQWVGVRSAKADAGASVTVDDLGVIVAPADGGCDLRIERLGE
jgi:hypothetical protein